jgi:hypothetical protein
MHDFDALEIARIIGEPRDPRRPYPLLVEKICDTDTADPNEYVYQFDVLLDTDKIITTSASGLKLSHIADTFLQFYNNNTPLLLVFMNYSQDHVEMTVQTM